MNEDDLDFDANDGGDDSSGSGDAPPASGKPDGQSDSKRINDLMSKWQKADEANKKLQQELQALRAGKPDGDQGGDAGGAKPADGEVPEQVRRWIETAKEGARERWFNSDARFATYGLDLAAIDGETPEAMQASAGRLKSLIDRIETHARNSVMAEYGLSPDGSGAGAPQGDLDFGGMSDEEFAKWESRAMRGAV